MNAITKLGLIFAMWLSVVIPASGIITFTNIANVPLVGTHFTDIAVADFNSDTNLDLVFVAHGGDGFTSGYIATGDGQGSFTIAAAGTAASASCVAAGDVNGDGKVDVVYGRTIFDRVVIVTGNGDGTFNNDVQEFFSVGSPTNVVGVALADVNSDGKLDLAAISTNMVYLFQGSGDGTFVSTTNFAAGGLTRCVTLTDVNNDGKSDLLVGLSSEGEAVYLNNGDGTFGAPAYFLGAFGGPSLAVGQAAAADFDGDGARDLAMTVTTSPFTRIYSGHGDGTFVGSPVAYVDGGGATGTRVAVGDWDGDGKSDLAIGRHVTGLRILVNQTMPPLYITTAENTVVRWSAEFGKLYQLEFSTLLDNTNWTTISTNNIFRIGADNFYTNTVQDEVLFFRLRK